MDHIIMKPPLSDASEADLTQPENDPEHNLVAERLVSINGLISLIMLSWSAVTLAHPAMLRRVIHGFWRRWPWIVGEKPPC
jgi:hypothetical protein